jgi:hypothetical protein
MAQIDKLLVQAKQWYEFRTIENYDFVKLTTDELKELAYGKPTEERFNELIDKMR